MRQILIELHTPGQRFGDFFILEHPSAGEDNFYQQAVSYSHFHTRELNRAFPDVSSGRLINGMNWMEYARSIKYCSEHHIHPGESVADYLARLDVDVNTVPVCRGVWDLYDKIGYDRKTKKYI